MVRQRRRIKTNENQMRIAIWIMVGFLIATAMGAVICNGLYGTKAAAWGGELESFFSGVRENGVGGSFSSVFIKYIKYGLFIWVGGFMAYGIVISGVVLGFRGVCLGFTTAMLLKTYGIKGFIAAAFTLLPQNIILIPVNLCLTWAAICFWQEQFQRRSGKAGLRRERQRRITEYSIFFGAALLLTGAAAFLETSVIPYFMKGAASFLV